MRVPTEIKKQLDRQWNINHCISKFWDKFVNQLTIFLTLIFLLLYPTNIIIGISLVIFGLIPAIFFMLSVMGSYSSTFVFLRKINNNNIKWFWKDSNKINVTELIKDDKTHKNINVSLQSVNEKDWCIYTPNNEFVDHNTMTIILAFRKQEDAIAFKLNNI